jgi:hypothetical protein
LAKNFQIAPPDLTETSEEEQSVEDCIPHVPRTSRREATEVSLLRNEVEFLRKRVEKLERGC